MIEVVMGWVSRDGVKSVHWNRCYEPWRGIRDKKKKKNLIAIGIEVVSYDASLLWEPWTISKDDGKPYKVFTPFYRKGCLQSAVPRKPLSVPKNLNYYYDHKDSLCINALKLLPRIRWDRQFEKHWEIGEKAGQKRLLKFIEEGLTEYKDGRNFPAKSVVSRLSPYLHFGEISANQLWFAIRSMSDNKNTDHFCSELGWREFSYSQLYHSPDLPTKNQQSKFDRFPWVVDETGLDAWQKGQTGVPLVDAGMRELWQTGYMHNRLRMIVGSFLIKNLRLHWQYGERWFWDTLVDADLANNSASWQWVAGCGADTAPYFRIFNPVTQGQKFDPDGNYVRNFIPEIGSLPNEYLFNPWDAPEHVLKKAGIKLGMNYPKPIVDLKLSRDLALEAFQSL